MHATTCKVPSMHLCSLLPSSLHCVCVLRSDFLDSLLFFIPIVFSRSPASNLNSVLWSENKVNGSHPDSPLSFAFSPGHMRRPYLSALSPPHPLAPSLMFNSQPDFQLNHFSWILMSSSLYNHPAPFEVVWRLCSVQSRLVPCRLILTLLS